MGSEEKIIKNKVGLVKHGSEYWYGKTPMQIFLEAKPWADAKMIEKAYSGREPSATPSPLYAAS